MEPTAKIVPMMNIVDNLIFVLGINNLNGCALVSRSRLEGLVGGGCMARLSDWEVRLCILSKLEDGVRVV